MAGSEVADDALVADGILNMGRKARIIQAFDASVAATAHDNSLSERVHLSQLFHLFRLVPDLNWIWHRLVEDRALEGTATAFHRLELICLERHMVEPVPVWAFHPRLCERGRDRIFAYLCVKLALLKRHLVDISHTVLAGCDVHGVALRFDKRKILAPQNLLSAKQGPIVLILQGKSRTTLIIDFAQAHLLSFDESLHRSMIVRNQLHLRLGICRTFTALLRRVTVTNETLPPIRLITNSNTEC